MPSRPAKRRVTKQPGRVTKPPGRVTPKGGSPTTAHRGDSTGRYTPPIPREQKISPMWVPVLMFTLLGLGTLMILLNYLGAVPGGTNSWYLVGGLGLILGGIITATNYH